MPKAIRIYEQGGPEVMKWEDVEIGPPGAGEIRMRHEVIGLNYIDTYHRGGVYRFRSRAASAAKRRAPLKPSATASPSSSRAIASATPAARRCSRSAATRRRATFPPRAW